MNDKKIIERLKELIKEGLKLESGLRRYDGYSSTREYNEKYSHDIVRWGNICLNLLKLRFGINSDYYDRFSNHLKTIDGIFFKNEIGKSLGALEYVCDALETGMTDDLFYKREVELLTDLLEQAYEFLKNGFKLASGIYGRIILETTIREFANKNGTREEKFDQLIIKLRQSDLISKPFENSLRANYEIGSWAAHGKEEFEKLSDIQKKEFLDFIRDKVLTLN